jgi:hypothetical protein
MRRHHLPLRIDWRYFAVLGIASLLGLAASVAAQETGTAPGDNDAPAETVPFNDDEWREAGEPDALGTRLRTCTIVIGPDGLIRGTIFRIDESTREQAAVKQIELLLVQDGETVETTTPDLSDGVFQFGPVKPGIYALIGQGADGLVAYSFHVESIPEENNAEQEVEVKPDPDADPNAPPAEKPVQLADGSVVKELHSTAIDPADMPMALELIKSFMGLDSGETAELDPETEAMLEEGDADNEMRTAKPAGSFFRGKEHLDAVPATSLAWHQIPLQADGTLIGRVRVLVAPNEEEGKLETRPPEDMRVFLLQHGRVIAQTPCTDKGIFVLPDVQVGIYSFVGVGADGFSVMLVEVLPSPEKKEEDQEDGKVKSASLRKVAYQNNLPTNLPNFDTAIVDPINGKKLQIVPFPSQFSQDLPDMGPLTGSDSAGTVAGAGTGSTSPGSVGGGGGGLSAPGGGFGGGAPVGGGGRGVTNPDEDPNEVPEIDPASAGVGFSVLLGVLLLLVDLYRPR